MQWTLPQVDEGGDDLNDRLVVATTPTAAGPASKGIRSLTKTALSDTRAAEDLAVRFSKAAAPTAPSPASAPATASSSEGASSSETVGLLQSLFPYYSYDDNTARLVQMTVPSVPRPDVDGRDDMGNTLLLLAIQYKAHDVMETLINMGADVNARNHAGSCCLHYACHYETFSEDTVRLLVSSGAAVTFAEEAAQGGLTPLHYAAETGHEAVCKFLVGKGADPAKRDAYGRTPPDCARDAGQDACAEAFAGFEVSGAARRRPGTAKVGGGGGALARKVSFSARGGGGAASPGGGGGGAVGGGQGGDDDGDDRALLPAWGLGEDAAEIKEALFKIQADLQRSLTSKESQRQEYETLIKERDLTVLGLRDRLAKAEAEHKVGQLAAEHGRLDVAALERRVGELHGRLASAEAGAEEERRARVASGGRLERRCLDLEGEVAAARARCDHEAGLRETLAADLARERARASDAAASHLASVREGAAAGAAVATLTERCGGLEREATRKDERLASLAASVEAGWAREAGLRADAAAAAAAAAAATAASTGLGLDLAAATAALAGERERSERMLEVLEELRSDGAATQRELALLKEALRSQTAAAAPAATQQQQQQQQMAAGAGDGHGGLSLEGALIEAKTRCGALEAEVGRLRAAEAQSLFADASRVALELAANREENAALRRDAADARQAAAEAGDVVEERVRAAEARAAAACREGFEAEAVALRAEVKELRARLAARTASAADMLQAKLDAAGTATARSSAQDRQLQAQVSQLQRDLAAARADAAATAARAAATEQRAVLGADSSSSSSSSSSSPSGASPASPSSALEAALAEARARHAEEVEAAKEEARRAAKAEAEAAAVIAAEASAVASREASRRFAETLEASQRSAASAASKAQRDRDESEQRIARLEARSAEAAAEAEAALASCRRSHAGELERLRADHASEVALLRRRADDERAAATAAAAELEARAAASAAEAAEVRLEAEVAARRAAGALREVEGARREAEERLAAMVDLIEEAKHVDKRNAVLDARMNIEIERRRRLHEFVEDLKGKIRVYVRVRPMSTSEAAKGCVAAYTKNHDTSLTYFQPDKTAPDDKKSFEFDKVFAGGNEDGNGQEALFNDLRGLVLSCVEGKNVCIFAYGQTGSGKTFSMVGPDGSIGGNIDAASGPRPLPLASAGVTPRAIVELFSVLEERDALNIGEVDVSMYELYCDSLVDLLAVNPRRARDKETGHGKAAALSIKLAQHTESGLVEVEGGTVLRTSTMAELIDAMERGVSARSTSATAMNAESSRSHLVMMLVVRSTNRRSGATVFGKLTLVDLAGSERVDKSGAEGQRLKEAASINKSLSAIGDVVAALTTAQPHVPYRSHALTTLMSDSIGGTAKTVMMVCCSPADYNTKESLSALAFAQRCKHVKNTGAGGTPAQAAAQVQALKLELARLKKANAAKGKAPDLDRSSALHRSQPRPAKDWAS